MNRSILPWAFVLSSAAVAASQEPAPVYQTQSKHSFETHVDAVLREERNETETFLEKDRRMGRLRARGEMSVSRLTLGAGGAFLYSSDENDENEDGTRPAVVRDNYKSRDARLDLAFGRLELSWLRLEGGRFEMPVALTEMIWDRDLRPQGGAITLQTTGKMGADRLFATALGAKGSHVFEDDEVEMLMGSAGAVLPAGRDGKLEVVGSYITFRKLDELDPVIKRQNTRAGGLFVHDYDVVDIVLRLRREKGVHTQLIADYCWNTAVDADNRGLWLGFVAGSTLTARGRMDYTYAKVDKDATVAAYAGDDFVWGTGWEGHRLDVGLRVSDKSAFHVVGQVQRFKDSPNEAQREEWHRRLRVELRVR